MKAVLGVDPGVNGGMALLRGDGSLQDLWGFTPNQYEADVVSAVCSAATALKLLDSRECVFERVGYMPHDGGKGSFTFGKVNGLLRGALLASGVAFHDVTPQVWQSSLDCLSGGKKNVTKLRAKQLFPGVKITHGVADALLIALYGYTVVNRS